MKKLNFLVGIAFLSLIALSSCKKEEVTLEQLSNPLSKSSRSTSYGPNNDALLADMARKVRVNNGILRFASQQGFDDYLIALESFQKNWEYGEENYNLIGDEALNALDDYLGFNSFRYKQDENYDINGPTSELEVDVASYTLASVLNDKADIWIGNTIYRMMRHQYMATIANSNLRVLNDLNEFGFDAQSPDLHFTNLRFGTGHTTTRPPYGGYPNSRSAGSCDLWLDGDHRGQYTRRTNIFFQNIDSDGAVDLGNVINNVSYTMEVKDVATGAVLQVDHWTGVGIANRDYTFPTPTTAFKMYAVKVTGQVLSNGEECAAVTTTKSRTITYRIENPALITCIKGDESKNIGRTFDGGSTNVTAKLWQSNTGFFQGIGCWTRYYKKINGHFRARRPDHWIRAEYDGYWASNSCQSVSQRKTSHSQGKYRCAEIKITHNSGDWGTFDDATNPAEAMYGKCSAHTFTGTHVLPAFDIH
ncbi:MAG: hypothetical protein ACRBFS_25775 [Aureispira sp.]